jgi:hypothetical protein
MGWLYARAGTEARMNQESGDGTIRPRRGRWGRRLGVAALVLIVAGAGYWLWSRRGPVETTEIYRGITYTCIELPEGPESRGLAHIVEVDLSAPGIELYLTPMDGEALAEGWQYKIDFPWREGRRRKLSVAVNAMLYQEEPSYLLWFERDLTPHLEHRKPPPEAALAKAHWGVSGQGVAFADGKISRHAGAAPDRRTFIAIDRSTRRLWLACFDHASPRYASQVLIDRGATEGLSLDGGSSTCMYLGPEARGVRGGTVHGGWRPVATTFGVRGKPLE